MASYLPETWRQLKGLSSTALMKSLKADGWEEDITRGATRGFRKDGARVVIHHHPKKTYRPRLLKALLADIGWTEADLERLKLM